MQKMQKWSDFERAQDAALKAELEKRLDAVTCPTCESQWFQSVPVSQFQADHHVLVGQSIPERPNTIPYILLRCVRCENMLLPRVIHQSRDIAAGTYDNFLDTLEEVGDTRSAKLEIQESDLDKGLPPRVNLLGVEFTREQLLSLKTLLEVPKEELKAAPVKQKKTTKTKDKSSEVQPKEQ